MSKYKAFKCDICGEEMQDNGRYLLKRRHIVGCIEGTVKEWHRLDICPKCTNDMLAWIKMQRLQDEIQRTKDEERQKTAVGNRRNEKRNR